VRISSITTTFCVALVLATAGGRVSAQPAPEPLLTSFAGVAVSPDGAYVADVESRETTDPAQDPVAHLVVRRVADGEARRVALPCGEQPGCSVSVPAWSHDGKSIAYVVHAPKSKTRDLVVATVSSAAIVPREVLPFSGTLQGARFSPDDTKIALLAVPGAHKEVGATQAGAAIVGEIGTAPDEQRIAIVPLDHAAVSYASPADLFVYEYDWLPSGDGFVGTAAHGDGDNNWWVARLYRFDARTASATEIYKPASAQQQLASPRVSPDGKYVAFVAGIMSDFGSTGGDLYRLATDGSSAAPVDLTPGTTASVTSLLWMCGRGDELTFTQLHGDRDEILENDATSTAPSFALESAPDTLSAGSGANVSRACAPSPVIAAVRQSFERAPEIALFAHGAWTNLTHENAAIRAEASARSIAWTSDGFDVQGWLLEPKGAMLLGKRAMITSVHGGPAAANVPRFIGRGSTRDLLRRGYAVFLPNPRGSFGQGEPFTLANVKDFGYGDLRDILAGVDAAEKADPSIDDARLGITGGSYGGFMTMWAVTQTNRFKAAVAGAGIANWISYYGENGIDEWMIPYFGASAYDDPAVYRKSSPIDFIKNVKTPTFEYVGERDVECPAPQSQEFWHALVAQDVPTSLVIYAGEGHGIRGAEHQADVTKRTLAWFAKYL
jgi:dipeptidyl aminopeptidase/acylaminoacyl peptidase